MIICDREICTGCAACKNICPLNCISMISDNQGFIRPEIDSTKCIDCGKCKDICPAVNPVDLKTPQKVYAAWSKDGNIHSKSASGGLATVFGKKVVENGGVVFGAKAEFKENRLTVFHTSAADYESVLAFQGSKYVQSETGNSFAEIKKLLKSGKQVLFCGTPCQTAGLKSFLGKSYDNLITVDIVCHGVPSVNLLNSHIAEIISNHQTDLQRIRFRENGQYVLSLEDKHNNVVYKNKLCDDLYLTGFLSGLFFRNSCYSCRYATKDRCSDITIGDFWGLGREIPFEHKAENGISLCMINTQKGAQFWKSVCNALEFEERELSEAVSGNGQLQNPGKEKLCSRKRFFEALQKNGPLIKQYGGLHLWHGLNIKS